MTINNNFQKNANTSLVAQVIWKSPGISRVAIAKELNLYRSTVTNIISTLIEWGVVHEAEEGESRAKGGRKPIIMRMNNNFGCIAGIEIQPSRYHAVLLDISGNLCWSSTGKIPDQGTFEDMISFLMDIITREIIALEVPLLAVCMGFPGIVDSPNGIVKYAEPFKLKNFDIFSHFKQHYRVPVYVENDANCAAWLEMSRNRSEPLGDFISIIGEYHEGNYHFGDSSGIGIGTAISIDGKVYHGSHNASGEIRSISWKKDSPGQTGLPRELLEKTPGDHDAWLVWMKDMFSSFVPIISILDPSIFFIHGRPFEDETKIIKALDEQVPEFRILLDMIGCELRFNAKDDFVVAKGAALMYLNKLFSVPSVSESDMRTHFDWDDVIQQVRRDFSGYRK